MVLQSRQRIRRPGPVPSHSLQCIMLTLGTTVMLAIHAIKVSTGAIPTTHLGNHIFVMLLATWHYKIVAIWMSRTFEIVSPFRAVTDMIHPSPTFLQRGARPDRWPIRGHGGQERCACHRGRSAWCRPLAGHLASLPTPGSLPGASAGVRWEMSAPR